MMRTILAMTMILISLAVLAANAIGSPLTQNAARVAFVVLCCFGLATYTVREFFLLGASIVLGVLLWRASDDYSTLLAGIDLAAYFGAFIALLTALKLAAERSNSVLTVGRYLISQPSGRRFVATASGGHVLGVFLNFGAISLMSPLIQSSTKKSDGTTDDNLERRQMSALLRGFAWILLWAPTTLTQTVLLTLFTEIDFGKIIVIGMLTSLLMMAIGLAYDRFEWRNHVAQSDQEVAPAPPRRAILRLALVCCVLIFTTIALQVSAGYTTALSLMFMAPTVTIIWFGFQRPAGTSLGVQAVKLWSAMEASCDGLARSAIALGLSGFIGRTAAEILPVAALSEHIDFASIPGWAFLAMLPALISIGGQIALSPIILVVFIGQVVQTLPALPADPTHVVFALSAGWALSMFMSPNSTATLLISATSKIPPTTLTWQWNLRYGMICYVVLVGIFVLLEST